MVVLEGIKLIVVFIGFKWIGKIINEFFNEGKKFMFVFEESYGLLIDENFLRDKDVL